MAHTPAWRNFKRTQDLTVVTASLIYAGAVVHAFGHLPGGQHKVVRWTLLFPAAFLLVSLVTPLLIGPLKRMLARWVWMSFLAGFGQTVRSILAGVLLLGGAAALIYWEISSAGERGPAEAASAFSSYAAGIGILAAQAALVRQLERDPEVRKRIEV